MVKKALKNMKSKTDADRRSLVASDNYCKLENTQQMKNMPGQMLSQK